MEKVDSLYIDKQNKMLGEQTHVSKTWDEIVALVFLTQVDCVQMATPGFLK